MSRTGIVFGRSRIQSIPSRYGPLGVYIGPLSDIGFDTNRTTSNTYQRQTAVIYIYRPLIVQAILWDISNNGTYTCRFVTTPDGTTALFTIVSSQAVTAAADVAFQYSAGDFLLTPGRYNLQLYSEGGNVNFADVSTRYQDNDYWATGGIWYTTGFWDSYSVPVRFRACPVNLVGGTQFGRL